MAIFLINPNFWAGRSIGIGLAKSVEGAGEFLKTNRVPGPIFNNYDIGGYLIYNLYPKERVFVDNRPEAYPADFFDKVYIPMQEDDRVWRENLAKYNFNAIVFYRQDATPWAQKFLIARVTDSVWIPVFVDDWVIIFVRNAPQNQDVISRFQISKDLFSF